MPLDQGITEKLESFARHVESSPHNLVSRRARSELRTRHIPECVGLATLLPVGSHRVLDVGSGGGFPGLVLAIVRPELEVHLLDSTAKKVDFLRETGAALDLVIDVHLGRAEELARSELSGRFDVVTARAVAPLRTLVAWTVPFLRVGGLLYAVKGEQWCRELEEASSAIERAGSRVVVTPEEANGGSSEGPVPTVVIIGRDR